MTDQGEKAGQPEKAGQLDVLLADYAAGGLSLPANALVAAHLSLSTRHAAFVDALEDIGGDWLDDVAPETLSDRDAALAAIFAHDAPAERAEPDATEDADDDTGLVPPVIRQALGLETDEIPWKNRLGIREVRRKFADGSTASLLWIKAGQVIPTHTHEGQELTLVLQGAFSDETGRYGPGDIAVADDDVDHMPVAEPDEDCICFIVMDAPLRFTGPVTRFLNPILNR